MPIQAQSADGVMHEFPDSTAPDVVDRVMKEYCHWHNGPAKGHAGARR